MEKEKIIQNNTEKTNYDNISVQNGINDNNEIQNILESKFEQYYKEKMIDCNKDQLTKSAFFSKLIKELDSYYLSAKEYNRTNPNQLIIDDLKPSEKQRLQIIENLDKEITVKQEIEAHLKLKISKLQNDLATIKGFSQNTLDMEINSVVSEINNGQEISSNPYRYNSNLTCESEKQKPGRNIYNSIEIRDFNSDMRTSYCHTQGSIDPKQNTTVDYNSGDNQVIRIDDTQEETIKDGSNLISLLKSYTEKIVDIEKQLCGNRGKSIEKKGVLAKFTPISLIRNCEKAILSLNKFVNKADKSIKPTHKSQLSTNKNSNNNKSKSKYQSKSKNFNQNETSQAKNSTIKNGKSKNYVCNSKQISTDFTVINNKKVFKKKVNNYTALYQAQQAEILYKKQIKNNNLNSELDNQRKRIRDEAINVLVSGKNINTKENASLLENTSYSENKAVNCKTDTNPNILNNNNDNKKVLQLTNYSTKTNSKLKGLVIKLPKKNEKNDKVVTITHSPTHTNKNAKVLINHKFNPSDITNINSETMDIIEEKIKKSNNNNTNNTKNSSTSHVLENIKFTKLGNNHSLKNNGVTANNNTYINKKITTNNNNNFTKRNSRNYNINDTSPINLNLDIKSSTKSKNDYNKTFFAKNKNTLLLSNVNNTSINGGDKQDKKPVVYLSNTFNPSNKEFQELKVINNKIREVSKSKKPNVNQIVNEIENNDNNNNNTTDTNLINKDLHETIKKEPVINSSSLINRNAIEIHLDLAEELNKNNEQTNIDSNIKNANQFEANSINQIIQNIVNEEELINTLEDNILSIKSNYNKFLYEKCSLYTHNYNQNFTIEYKDNSECEKILL